MKNTKACLQFHCLWQDNKRMTDFCTSSFLYYQHRLLFKSLDKKRISHNAFLLASWMAFSKTKQLIWQYKTRSFNRPAQSVVCIQWTKETSDNISEDYVSSWDEGGFCLWLFNRLATTDVAWRESKYPGVSTIVKTMATVMWSKPFPCNVCKEKGLVQFCGCGLQLDFLTLPPSTCFWQHPFIVKRTFAKIC